jgi:hypothetical protein
MTLPEALAPLYRSYLRRLDEMVARLPDGAALTERTSRNGGDRLAFGDDGLPLRFDVADARDGHTYEVHGARADEPLANEVRIASLRVLLEPGNWEELTVLCVFEAEPSAEETEALVDLLRSFTVVGWYGGFAAAAGIATSRWTGRTHGIRLQRLGREVAATFDLGTCPPSAVEALCAALSGYAEERGRLAYVRLGGKAERG